MPYKIYDSACRTCGKQGVLFREKYSKQNDKFYKQPDCRDCDFKAHSGWVDQNRDRNRQLAMDYYFRKNGPRKRRSHKEMTDEMRRDRLRLKAQMRATRAKKARVSWDTELTELVMKEAIDLRHRLFKITGVEYHIDHIIPLKGDIVCGLHVWNNLAVIPKVDNLRKGNNFALPA